MLRVVIRRSPRQWVHTCERGRSIADVKCAFEGDGRQSLQFDTKLIYTTRPLLRMQKKKKKVKIVFFNCSRLSPCSFHRGFLSGRKSKELHRLVCGKLLEKHDAARITQNHSLLFFGLILNYTKGGKTKFVFSLEMKMHLHTLRGVWRDRPWKRFLLTATFFFHFLEWRLFIFILRESKWGTLKSAGNPRCAVPAKNHSICTDRRRPGPAATLQMSPTSDTCQSVAILMNRPHSKFPTLFINSLFILWSSFLF